MFLYLGRMKIFTDRIDVSVGISVNNDVNIRVCAIYIFFENKC